MKVTTSTVAMAPNAGIIQAGKAGVKLEIVILGVGVAEGSMLELGVGDGD